MDDGVKKDIWSVTGDFSKVPGGKDLNKMKKQYKPPGGKDLNKLKKQYEMFVDVVGSKQVTGVLQILSWYTY